jgi:hypothetical protein
MAETLQRPRTGRLVEYLQVLAGHADLHGAMWDWL